MRREGEEKAKRRRKECEEKAKRRRVEAKKGEKEAPLGALKYGIISLSLALGPSVAQVQPSVRRRARPRPLPRRREAWSRGAPNRRGGDGDEAERGSDLTGKGALDAQRM